MKEPNIVPAICIKCNKKYWSTEGYEAMVKAGLKAQLCFFCDPECQEEYRERLKTNP